MSETSRTSELFYSTSTRRPGMTGPQTTTDINTSRKDS